MLVDPASSLMPWELRAIEVDVSIIYSKLAQMYSQDVWDVELVVEVSSQPS